MRLRKLDYALILILIASVVTFFYQAQITGNVVSQQILSLDDYAQTRVSVNENNIYLISGCEAVVITTTPEQTSSIRAGLENVSGFRPSTHDLMGDVISLFDVEVIMVKVEKLENSTYYSRLFLQQGNRILNLDSRPSDAIAIAVRYDKPVFVKNRLLINQGINIC